MQMGYITYDTASAFSQTIMFGANAIHWTFNYYLLIPALATLPFGISYLQDKKGGYIKNILVRTSQKSYYRAKYLAVFLSGGTVSAVPLLLEVFFMGLFFPLKTAAPYTDMAIGPSSMWVNLYYSNTLLYALAYALLIFVFGGLAASLALVVSRYLDYIFTVWVTPFLVVLAIHNVASILIKWNWSPLEYLRAYQPAACSVGVIFLQFLVLLILGIVLFVRRGSTEDVY